MKQVDEVTAPPKRRNRKGQMTRKAIIDATIETLNERGYAATSIEAVMSASALGRGSVLNQFPTRHDLMVSTVEVGLSRMVSAAWEKISALTDAVHAVRALFDISWQSHQLTAATAVTEIILASRWDRPLAEALELPVERMESRIDATYLRLANAAGIDRTTEFLVYVRLLNSNMRGITIELMLGKDRKMILAALDAMRADYTGFIERMLPGQSSAA